ncbi:cytidylate kinase [Moryella indoligenes]|uniref:Cytidylate kinase n=1 Tax=Moryella indoligenes TaxID=371674 RepID=A0AAE3VBB2_9FIRM|nr:(d)CMP kinase [Moryella indoligenes]MDQ0152913.1 cytidylate kinase [Moryella indoligenes]
MEKIRALAIDGPAGAGKSTIAKAVSRELNWIYVDTGAMFRAIALFLTERGTDTDSEEAVAAALDGVDIALRHENGEQRIFLNGRDVSAEIREEAVGNMASRVSVYPAVRNKLLFLQRQLAAAQPVVMDGRDIGTVVLPNADTKIYLTASAEVRAKRRLRELLLKGQSAELAEVQRDIEARDYRDMHRETAPLRQAEDAVLLDSSDMSAAEVQRKILSLVRGSRER